VILTAAQLKKKWIKIFAPDVFGNMEIGETLCDEEKKVMGRTIEKSLYELTGDASKYYINLIFKVNFVDSAQAKTIYYGHSCTSDFLSRIVQPRTSKVAVRLPLKLKDASIVVKAVAITERTVGKRIQSEIRKKIIESFQSFASSSDLSGFVKGFTSGKIQNQIRQVANKIYPIRIFEIYKTEVLSVEQENKN
jgi:small subunit ribosomal protein S3Ae